MWSVVCGRAVVSDENIYASIGLLFEKNSPVSRAITATASFGLAKCAIPWYSTVCLSMSVLTRRIW